MDSDFRIGFTLFEEQVALKGSRLQIRLKPIPIEPRLTTHRLGSKFHADSEYDLGFPIEGSLRPETGGAGIV